MKSIKERTKYRHMRRYILTNALKYFAKIIIQNEDAKVLDYGCGNAQLKSMISCLNYYGFDIDVENEKANYYSLEELEGLRFDYIVPSHVLEHQKSKKIEETLTSCYKHLKKDGQVLIATPYSNLFTISLFWWDPTHLKPLSYLSLAWMLENKGFKVMEIFYSSPFINIFKWFLCILSGEWIGTEFGIIAKKYSKRVD
jgi:2-polyprenyl-3-methyl-5-hydroxy-6-metoxy-1,4-benzoquinol methylase